MGFSRAAYDPTRTFTTRPLILLAKCHNSMAARYRGVPCIESRYWSPVLYSGTAATS